MFNYSQKFLKEMTGLHLTAYFGVKETVEGLLQWTAAVDAKDEYSRTSLLSAAENGHNAVVERLLATGKVDINVKATQYGRTPLLWGLERP